MFFDTKECEWSDNTIYLNGAKITKIRGFKFKKAKEKEHLHAGGSKAISIQGGNEALTGDFTVLKGALRDMNAAALAAGGEDITDVVWTVVSTFKAKGNRVLQTSTLIGLEFTEYEEGMTQGAKFMEVTLPFLFLDLKTV
ncbi:MAG: hypothetical protein H0X62_05915 [Bacteroidetes bacterium]|nr:hypothetical protein [Bacteroidota bacterium]